jgi:hypothetical protein
MRPYQIFAAMSPARGREVLHAIGDAAPGALVQAMGVTCAAMRVRPVFLQKQPLEKRLDLVKRTLSRVSTDELAEELLAVYFLHCRKDLLVAWLDLAGVEHDDGTLKSDRPPAPDDAKLADAVSRFRGAGDGSSSADRELLLRAFAAQGAVDWPALERELEGADAAKAS